MANFVVTVRYGLMATTERFVSESDEVRVGDQVIVRTVRGVDFGEAMSRAREHNEAEETHGELLRPANEADLSIFNHIRDAREPEEFVTCQKCIAERELPMRLVGVEHLFSGDKIIFYFLADNRVDFRELVKELARRYRTRIEMRQIGVRDEARLLADYEHCGRELCCRTFIRNLEPVTMRMAKMQKTTLDPSKISGHCGRLMCCLRFEDDVYASLQSDMPARGAICVTETFTGEVASTDMFRQEILLTLPDGSQETVHLSDIKEIQGRRGGKGNTGVQPDTAMFPGPGRSDGQGRASGRLRVGENSTAVVGEKGAPSGGAPAGPGRRDKRPSGRGGEEKRQPREGAPRRQQPQEPRGPQDGADRKAPARERPVRNGPDRNEPGRNRADRNRGGPKDRAEHRQRPDPRNGPAPKERNEPKGGTEPAGPDKKDEA